MVELLHYEGTPMPSGETRYNAPEGEHDDGCIFLMLANMGRENYIAPARLGIVTGAMIAREDRKRRASELEGLGL